MKILVYGINFAPELTGIGKFTGEMVDWLVRQGHDVRVIAAPPYYPSWKVAAGYSGFRYRTELWRGAQVFRVPLWIPKQPSGLKRILHLVSFAISSLPILFAQWGWRPQIVWVTEPPFFCAPAVCLFSYLRGSKSWLHIQDYELDAAFDLGLLKGRVVKKMAESFERLVMRRFDRVSTISKKMAQRANQKGVDLYRIVSFPNWVDISSIRPLAAPSVYRAELDISVKSVVALYSGNMGGKQGLEVLAQVARALEDVPGLKFIFCGNGAGRLDLQERCAGLDNVFFLDLQPLEKLNQLLGVADIHLLPQRAGVADLVMPSKLTGMLASGRSIVAAADDDTQLASVVKRCGLVVPPEDGRSMADAIRLLASDDVMRARYGGMAREIAENEIELEAVLRKFELDLAECVG